MGLPTLSVIIPNYNHAQHLPVCLKSILAQSVKPVEIIVLDDASTDNSIQVLQEFAAQNPTLRLVQNEMNLGVLPNVNKGLSLARGEYLFLQAADDEVLPGLFEKSLKLLAQHPEAGLSCTIADWREAATGLNWHMGVGMGDQSVYFSPQEMVELERQRRLFIASHTVILKRSALLAAGKFLPELKAFADWFTCCVIGFRYGICFIPEPLGIQNIVPNSFYQRCRRDKKLRQQMLSCILEILNRQEYRDVAELMRQAGSLYLYGAPMISLLLSRPEYRSFITPVLVRNGLWHNTKVVLKKFLPASLGNLYFRLAGYRAPRSAA
jgi:glycosyltransferase involved in cell wall biosynthesis